MLFGCWISRDVDRVNKNSSGWRDAGAREMRSKEAGSSSRGKTEKKKRESALVELQLPAPPLSAFTPGESLVPSQHAALRQQGKNRPQNPITSGLSYGTSPCSHQATMLSFTSHQRLTKYASFLFLISSLQLYLLGPFPSIQQPIRGDTAAPTAAAEEEK